MDVFIRIMFDSVRVCVNMLILGICFNCLICEMELKMGWDNGRFLMLFFVVVFMNLEWVGFLFVVGKYEDRF